MIISRTQSMLWITILLYSCYCLVVEAKPLEKKMIRKTGKPVGDLAMSVEVSKESYEFGETILLTVVLKNVGEKQFRTRKTSALGMFKINVILPDGKKAPLTLFGKKHALGSAFASGFIVLSPKEEYSASIHLARYFDMTLSGKYSIDVSKKVSVGNDGKATVSSPSLTIAILEK